MKNTFKVTIISCWFQDKIYSQYSNDLKKHLMETNKIDVDILTSECACGSNRQQKREALYNRNCNLISIPFTTNGFQSWPMKQIAGKWRVKNEFNRGKQYLYSANGSDLFHFQQVTDAFGSLPTFGFLYKSPKIKKVVTVHEVDEFQLKHKSFNRLYNKADKIITHSNYLKAKLGNLGVRDEKIIVIPIGMSIPKVACAKPEFIVFYGGHHLFSGKGFYEFLNAIKILKSHNKPIPVKIFGGYSPSEESKGQNLIQKMQLTDYVEFVDKSSTEELNLLYQNSKLAVIPFTSGLGAYAVVLAMMNGTPVLASKSNDIPEYALDYANYLDAVTPAVIANSIIKNLSQPSKYSREECRNYAWDRFSWSKVTEQTLQLYQEILT